MTLKRLAKNKRLATVGMTLLAVLITLVLSSLAILNQWQLQAINTLFAVRGPAVPADTSIVIVAIDDQSIKSLPGKMPYPRSYFARMVNNLSEAGARLIIFDLEFTEPSSTAPAEDSILADAIAHHHNVILAGKIVQESDQRVLNSQYVVKPLELLLGNRTSWGIVNVPEDVDGFIRSYLLFLSAGEQVYYPLAVQAADLLLNSGQPLRIDPAQTNLELGPMRVPKVKRNTMWINFRGPAGTFRTYSMASILDDPSFQLAGEEDTDIFEQYRVWGTFRDKIVFIGASAEELQDNKFTPFFEYQQNKRKMPGVELHANALSTLLRGDFIQTVPTWAVWLTALLLALLTGFLTTSLRPFRAFAAVLFLSLVVIAGLTALFLLLRYLFPIIVPVLSLSISFVLNLISQIVHEQREKHRIRQTFQQYVAPAVVEKMLSSGELPSYGGERKELTVLFSDIRSFTRFSESHEPEVVVSHLSEYLTKMVDVIFKYNGTLDKFVGDEIMAVFGAPYHYADHPERACRTALEMVTRLRQMQKEWSARGEEYFNIGIGINTGKMIIGNLGSQQLFDYTVIGDQVNLGARLEGLNKEYGTTIIISEYTYEAVRNTARVRELDLVRVMGRTQPIRIYELRGLEPLALIEQEYLIDIYTAGLLAYRNRQWAEALKAFRRVLRYFPTDGPSRVYTKRCLDFLEHPAPPQWDGVYEMKQK